MAVTRILHVQGVNMLILVGGEYIEITREQWIEQQEHETECRGYDD